ncbi:hypothetical protein [Deinococcus sp.]|uniref:hypothetical protein n=1 Tax=Deinococcus sp. TaxID=47478 RepID=UPI0025C2B1A5|nr:hypothetical protein [Deinococcus sp.]
MALQGGEVLTVRGVPGLGLAPVAAEAVGEGLRHLPLQRLEFPLFLRARNDARLGELLRVLDTRTWKARVRVDVNPRGGV